jgi:hypothetical protein
VRLYHGSPDASRIFTEGFDLWTKRNTDPGDLGWGIYLTGNWYWARQFAGGEGAEANVIELDIDPAKLARIRHEIVGCGKEPNLNKAERLWRKVVECSAFGIPLTIASEPKERAKVAKMVRRRFMRAGYTGILAGTVGKDEEVVVFNLGAIRRFRRAKPKKDD